MATVVSETETSLDYCSNASAADLRGGPCSLPARIRALYITGRQNSGAWLADAFAAECTSHLIFEEATDAIDAAARLRDEPFDVVFINHLPGEFDALEFLEAVRVGGFEEAVLVLGTPSERVMAAVAYEAGADAYLCVENTTTRALLWTVGWAIQRHELLRENHRLQQLQQQRLEQEHQEAARLLADQRQMVQELEVLAGDQKMEVAGLPSARDELDRVPATMSPEGLKLPSQLVGFYREMLRAYVIMGAGNLSAEMNSLAELLVAADVSAQQAMLLHVRVLEEQVRGLGSRSARHVMVRADLLILELMIHLADGYRELYREQCRPKQQLLLTGLGE